MLDEERTDFLFTVEELNPKAEAEMATYDAIFHAPEKED